MDGWIFETPYFEAHHARRGHWSSFPFPSAFRRIIDHSITVIVGRVCAVDFQILKFVALLDADPKLTAL